MTASRHRPLRIVSPLAFVLLAVPAAPAFASAPSPTAGQPSAPGSPAGQATPAATQIAPVTVSLRATPASPQIGRPLQIAVVDPPAGASDFRWALPGASAPSPDTGAQPVVATRFLTAGAHRVTVEVTAGGRLLRGALSIVVAPAASAGVAEKQTSGSPHPVQSTAAIHPHRLTRLAAADPKASPSVTGVRAVARAASDPGVNIVDFSFSPGTTTVHVGDTITWTNTGKQPHTATANNRSFDTGILTTGHSASHAFTQAGTFTYYCTVHPYMHGTVVVEAAASSTPSTTSSTTTHAASNNSTSSPSAAANTTAAATQATGPSLPMTGLDVRLGLAIGVLLVGIGYVLRRRSRIADSES